MVQLTAMDAKTDRLGASTAGNGNTVMQACQAYALGWTSATGSSHYTHSY